MILYVLKASRMGIASFISILINGCATSCEQVLKNIDSNNLPKLPATRYETW